MSAERECGPMQFVGGKWVPAIPEPYYLLWRVRCHCGAKFWRRSAYNLHYQLTHLWE